MKIANGRMPLEIYADVFHVLATNNETEIARDLLSVIQFEYPTKSLQCDNALISLQLARRVEDGFRMRMEYFGEDY